jgi:hypothetical protein
MKLNQPANVWIIGTQLREAVPAHITAIAPDGSALIYWIESIDGVTQKSKGTIKYANVKYSDFTQRYNIHFKDITRVDQ